MKYLKNIFFLLILFGLGTVSAQSTRKEKQAAKEAAMRTLVNSKTYTFSATYVLPQRGGGHALTSEYDMRITRDSVISFLPFFGQAYFDVPYGGGNDAGIKFTSTKFDYKIKGKKKGGWEVVIELYDTRNIRQVMIHISSDGYATLSVNSDNRDFISFNGYIKANGK